MQMIIQDLESVKPTIQAHFKRYPNASISAMFRRVRKSPRVSFFGDYPLISLIVTTANDMGIVVSRPALRRACRLTKELKGKVLMVDQLLNYQLTCDFKHQMTKNKQERS
jgi:hypothetical protein